jgi:glycyl-tRNA synthetase (class II)
LDFADRLKKSRQEVEEYKADEIIEESVETEVPSVAVEAEEEKEVEEVLERTVLIRGTVEQLTRLADYMNQQKIYFKKL